MAKQQRFYRMSSELVDAMLSGDVNRVLDAYLDAYSMYDPSRPMEHPCHGRLLQTRRWLEARGYSVRMVHVSTGTQIAVTDNRTGMTWYSRFRHSGKQWFDEEYAEEARRLERRPADPVARLIRRCEDRWAEKLDEWEDRADAAVDRINARSNAGGILADIVKTAIFGSPRY